MTFAMTFPPGTHAMWMRYYLARAASIPTRTSRSITVPPPQMVANMKVGKMDGFCVGEPWNARAIADGIGFTVDHHAGHLEGSSGKGLRLHRGVRGEESEDGQGGAQGAARSERLARRPGQSPGAVRRSSRAPTYINCPPEIILGRLQGKYDYGDGRKTGRSELHDLQPAELQLSAAQVRACGGSSQFRRWGMVEGAPDYEGVAKQVMRAGPLRRSDEGNRLRRTAARTTSRKRCSTA